MRQASVAEPELLIEALGIDHERVAFPFPDRTAVIKRVIGVVTKLGFLLPPVGVDDAVVPVTASNKHKDAFPVMILGKLNSVRELILAGATRPHAKHVRTI